MRLPNSSLTQLARVTQLPPLVLSPVLSLLVDVNLGGYQTTLSTTNIQTKRGAKWQNRFSEALSKITCSSSWYKAIHNMDTLYIKVQEEMDFEVKNHQQLSIITSTRRSMYVCRKVFPHEFRFGYFTREDDKLE